MRTFHLFDIDGTLLHSEKRDSQTFARCYAEEFGRPFPTIDWTKFPEVTDHVIFRTAFREHFDRHPTTAERDDFEERYVAALTQVRSDSAAQYPEVPGAVAYWRSLERDPQAILGIATGGWRRPQSVKLAHLGLPENPPYASYADGMDSRVAILQAAIAAARKDHAFERIVYYGDAVWDVTTCRKMGLPMVGVRRHGDHEKLREVGCAAVITNFSDPQEVAAVVALALR